MDLQSPVFSVIIPTYNRAHLIGATLSSVLQQKFADFEILVVDDGSTDNTEQIINEFSDHRISYFRKANGERGAARNFGLSRAKGVFVNFFDSDDLMYPNHLQVAFDLIQSSQDPAFFHLAYDHKLEDGTIVSQVNDFKDDIRDVVLFDNRLSCDGVFVRRKIALKFPFEEDRVMASSEDWELWIRLLSTYHLDYSNVITSSIVNHNNRSLRTIGAEKVVARDLLLVKKLKADPAVVTMYGQSFKRFIADRYTFFMLSYSEESNRTEVMRWALRATAVSPGIIFSKRFLASIRNVFLK